ncbi:hypothetical protein CR969_00090 [Candidatus Saccharibacteria bacterium]|nr:MAG: hypothetical protein CR969_00090 [Candidatus Saccharibacteria bacterium]
MRKFIKGFLAALVAATFALSPVHASGYINQADISTIDSAIGAYTKFIDTTNDSDFIESPGLAKSKAALAVKHMEILSNHTFSKDLGDKYTQESEVLKSKAAALGKELSKFDKVVASADRDKINTYFSGLNKQAKQLDDQIDKLNDAVDESNNSVGVGYLWATVASAILAVGAFIWAFGFGKKDAAKSKELAKARRQVAYGSLAPLAGAAITYFSFMFADELGGSYVIAYGPILFGAIFLVKAIANYINLSKKPV